MSYPTLKYGDKGNDVKVLQAILQSQGFFDGEIAGNFLSKTLQSLQYFQQTHQGPDGQFLEVDGVVGPNTWWALENPVGDAQRSFIDPRIPDGICEARQNLLSTALNEHKIGVTELPGGSNWGDGVTKYLEGIGPAPWCCYFYSWVYHQVHAAYPLDARHGHCLTFWKAAKKFEKAHDRKVYVPIPGDAFVMLYRSNKGTLTGSGHIGFVLSVSPDGKAFNTIEGNAGDRVKVGTRYMSQSTLEGFINLHDMNKDFERVLLPAGTLNSSLSSTR